MNNGKVVRFANAKDEHGTSEGADTEPAEFSGGLQAAPIDELDDYLQAALATPPSGYLAKIPHDQLAPQVPEWPLQTTFTTIGPATSGTRQRIRYRQHRELTEISCIAEGTERDTDGDASAGGMKRNVSTRAALITAADLREIRELSWKPLVYHNEGRRINCSIPYNYAWEIGRRGSVAFQQVKWTIFGSWFPQVTTRFLILDGTDPDAFMTVYKNRRREWTRVRVFSAHELFRAQWDPVGGSFRVFYKSGSKVVTEEYYDVSRAFVIATMACLRELAVWSQVLKRSDFSKLYSSARQAPTRRRSTLLNGSVAGAGESKRVMSKFIQTPMLMVTPNDLLDAHKDGGAAGAAATPPTSDAAAAPADKRRLGWFFF